ncbi:MAG: putative glycoside hydrolase [Anaerolineales bacterium]
MASRSFWLFAVLGTLVLCTCILGCSLRDPVLTGRVRDSEDGRGIPHAHIEIAGQDLSTDEEGQFDIRLDLGRYHVAVSAFGYVRESFTVRLHEGTERYVCDVDLERRRIRGQVFDASTRQPLSDVQVSSGNITGTTETDGNFVLSYPERQSLSFTEPCYHDERVSGEEIETRFTMSGTLTEPLSVFLAPHSVEGIVREEGSREPVAGARIRVGETTTQSDEEGRYRLMCLSSGSAIAFSSSAHHPYTLTYESDLGDVFLTPWRTEVRVLDASTGKPLAQARLASSRDEVLTDADGWGRVRVPLEEKVHVSHDGYHVEELLFTGQSSIEVSLRPSRLTLELVDAATGAPVETAHAVVYSSEDRSPTVLRLDEEGEFVLDDVFGVQECLIKAPGYVRASVQVTQTGHISIPLEQHRVYGLYVPFGLLTLPERLSEILDLVETSDKINGIVVDVKGDRARLAWRSELPLAQDVGAYQQGVVDLQAFVQECNERGVYTIARMVIFKDDLLAQERPEWAVKRESGEFYLDWENLRWTDPFRQEVRDYNIALALEVIEMGFDEVQFDYLRFPSDGKVSDLVYEQESTFETRTAAMDAFCAQAYEEFSKTPAFFSADVFGLTVWVDPGRDLGIGQRINDIAPHVDYISPMLYPTTFIPGNLGFDEPARYPYEVIYHSVVKLQERVTVPVRPWLQHYSLGRTPYGISHYLLQRKAAEDAEGMGWLFWNSRGRYEEAVLEADPYHRLERIPSPPQDEAEEALN